ncbi:hypothetical protein [Paraburkholderia hospita]|nr:hypothetical protein [Paraburkholderia hospita]
MLINDMLHLNAQRFGKFLGRKGDGELSVKPFWRGRLEGMTAVEMEASP